MISVLKQRPRKAHQMKKAIIAALVVSLAVVAACAAKPKDHTNASAADAGSNDAAQAEEAAKKSEPASASEEATAGSEASTDAAAEAEPEVIRYMGDIPITTIVNDPVQVNDALSVSTVHMKALTVDIPVDFIEGYTDEELGEGSSFDFASDDGAKMSIRIDGPGAVDADATIDPDGDDTVLIEGVPSELVRYEADGVRTLKMHSYHDTYEYWLEFSYPTDLADKYELYGDTFYTVILMG